MVSLDKEQIGSTIVGGKVFLTGGFSGSTGESVMYLENEDGEFIYVNAALLRHAARRTERMTNG